MRKVISSKLRIIFAALEVVADGCVHSGDVSRQMIDDPINMENSNFVHYHLVSLLKKELLAVRFTTYDPANFGELQLLTLTDIRPKKSQIKERLRHLSSTHLK